MNLVTHIALISLSTPTFNNVRAASALPFHLIKGAKESGNYSFEVWSYNINDIDDAGIRETEKAIGAKIHILQRPSWMKLILRLHLSALRAFLHYPFLAYCQLSKGDVNDIKDSQPDIIWIYGEELAGLARLFPKSRRIVTMPDSEAMYYHRVLAINFMTRTALQKIRYCFGYRQYRTMERELWTKEVTYHFVGEADAAFYKGENPAAKALFLRHPHYAYTPRNIAFHHPRIRLLFAGRCDIYSAHASASLIDAMIAHSQELRDSYEVTFLGAGWEHLCEKMTKAGWKAHIVLFAPDYIAELQQHDIQINAIDVGTGTKGKVLDAIVNGLLVIGTPLALENIAVKDGESCIIYRHPDEAIDILRKIPSSANIYERMASQGRDNVLLFHSPSQIAQELFGDTANNLSSVDYTTD